MSNLDRDLAAIKARAAKMDAEADACRTAGTIGQAQRYAAACIDSGRDVPALLAEVDELRRLLMASLAPTDDAPARARMAEEIAQAIEEYRLPGSHTLLMSRREQRLALRWLHVGATIARDYARTTP
jgi:hypothetical protein